MWFICSSASAMRWISSLQKIPLWSFDHYNQARMSTPLHGVFLLLSWNVCLSTGALLLHPLLRNLLQNEVHDAIPQPIFILALFILGSPTPWRSQISSGARSATWVTTTSEAAANSIAFVTVPSFHHRIFGGFVLLCTLPCVTLPLPHILGCARCPPTGWAMERSPSYPG